MIEMTKARAASRFRRVFPPLQWLAEYQAAWLGRDVVAGVTLAAYAIPVSLAYAGLAGLPPQAGVYGYVLGGLGYALFGSSRQLAVGPTSAISLMIAVTVGPMADGDMHRYVQIASLAALAVALLAFLSWLLRLSVLVLLISDSVLVGFKIGAGLIIAMTQIPSILGTSGGGHNFFERVVVLAGQLQDSQILVIAVGLVAVALLLIGDRVFPGRPVALAVVITGIAAASVFGLRALGVPATGHIPAGLPSLSAPSMRLRDIEGIMPLAAGCLLLAYIEGVSAARTFASKHRYELDTRQEFLGIGAANLATAFGQGYPVAGGLSQSAVNDKAGARSPLALVFASIALALCLLYLTDLLENLPKAVLAAVVLTAILGLFDIAALRRMWRVSRMDFYAAIIAILAVLALGILHGILLSALACIVLLLLRVSRPNVAFLGRLPGTDVYSDMVRHPDSEAPPHALIVRPESSLIYANADVVSGTILKKIEAQPVKVGLVVCDLSASPFIDLAGTRMLHELAAKLVEQGTRLRIVGARGYVREVLRADGVAEKVGGIDKALTIGDVLAAEKRKTGRK